MLTYPDGVGIGIEALCKAAGVPKRSTEASAVCQCLRSWPPGHALDKGRRSCQL